MTSRFFLSLTAFSLIFSLSVCAEQFSVSNEEVEEEFFEEASDSNAEKKQEENVLVNETAEQSRRIAFPQKNAMLSTQEKTGVQSEQKKLKPHYAGVRKPQPKSVTTEKKKSSKIKNKWFSSKTHPKVEKKEIVEEEIVMTSAELQAERPFYIRKAALTAENSSDTTSMKSGQSVYASNNTQPHRSEEGQIYPKAGFQAPAGHFYLTAEYLLWRTRQEGMEFATAKRVNFEFDSGFRVGLGVHSPCDGWDVYVNYTNFNPTQSNNAHGSFYPLFLYQGPNATKISSVSNAHAHWKMGFQNLDVEIGRAYYIAKTLTFRPFIGLKGAWIDQHANIHYQGGVIPAGQTFRTHFKNDFKGAGPLIGIESNWLLGAGFSFFGNLAAALVVGHFDNEQQQHQLNGAEVVHLDTAFNLVSPTVQMIAGLAWDRNFNRDQCHFGLSAGFETQYWWSQNQIEQFTDDDLPINVRVQGGLAFYGLTLRARFDF